MMTNLNALPPLTDLYPVSPDQKAAYQKNGWVLLPGVASPEETAAYRPLLRETTMAHTRESRPLAERDTYGRAFIQVGNLWKKSELCARFSLSPRFAKIAADLMGVPSVRIYHDQALYKEPGGGPTPWHQDQQYWPLDGAKCVTLWMPLVDASRDMGTMRFASASQDLGYLGPQNISDESEAKWAALIAEKGYSTDYAGAMHAGDATFHDGWVLHGAPGNNAPDQTREVMTIIYLEADARITVPDSPARENDLRNWFPGRKPGDTAASDINPVVWSKDN